MSKRIFAILAKILFDTLTVGIMIIKNFEKLATSQLRRQALQIAEAGLQAINTQQAFERNFVYDAASDRVKILGKKYDLSKFQNVYCIAFGKAAFAGIAAVASILGKRLTSGFAIDVADNPPAIANITFRTGTHPHPTEQNVAAAKSLIEFVSTAKENDLVLCLISGGGSALLCLPHTLDVASQAAILKELMNSGADIFEMNCVRKHLSSVKGGQLTKIIYPAKLISLIFSDVPGDDLSTIASGPTVKDETTVRDALKILDKYQILQKLNLPTVKFLETPKDNKYFANTENILFVSARTGIAVMKEKAEDLGFDVKIFSEHFQGEARAAASQILQANNVRHQCLLGAGESTVVVKGSGAGGRNQHLALAALSSITENQVLIALASDGRDNSDSAGAIVDMSTVNRAKNLGLDHYQYLENSDSFTFFEAVGDGLQTGLTGSNVADLVICVKN